MITAGLERQPNAGESRTRDTRLRSDEEGVVSVSLARALPCAVAMLVGVPAGCTWDSYVSRGRPSELPENAPREIRTLVSCEPFAATLDCASEGDGRECNHWYRVDVTRPAEMRVDLELESPGASGGSPGGGEPTRLVVKPFGEAIRGQQVSLQGEPLSLRLAVEPDLYGVLVQGAGARRSYQLRVAVVDPATPLGRECPAAPRDGREPD